jgi:polyhydroxybutyrate depolymerase
MAARGVAWASLAAVAALLVTACSSGDDGGASGESVSDESSGAAAGGGADGETDAGGAEDVAAVPSGGCDSSSAAGVAAGESKLTLAADAPAGDTSRDTTGDPAAGERWYIRHVPPAHDGTTPVPVVVDLHGYSEGADVHVAMSGLGPYGDEQGFVTITPHAGGAVPFWETDPAGPDVAFVSAVLDDVERSLCVDAARVFVTGLSNGAMLTSTLACEVSDRFAAAAPVAGVTEVAGCAADRPVPVVAFHGTEDQFLRYEGGFGPAVADLPSPSGEGTLGDAGGTGAEDAETAAPTGPSVPEVVAEWADRNGCDDEPPREERAAADVTLLRFDCPPGAEAELYRVEGGGHAWPGSELSATVEAIVGHTTMAISANEVMWDFFERHPLATGGGES